MSRRVAVTTYQQCGCGRRIIPEASEASALTGKCYVCRGSRGGKPRQLAPPPAPPGGFADLDASRQPRLHCREEPEFFHLAEAVLDGDGWEQDAVEIAAEAHRRCAGGGCPIRVACWQAAKNERWTGAAGGDAWRGGQVVP